MEDCDSNHRVSPPELPFDDILVDLSQSPEAEGDEVDGLGETCFTSADSMVRCLISPEPFTSPEPTKTDSPLPGEAEEDINEEIGCNEIGFTLDNIAFDNIATDMANELNRLSIKERDNVLYDIHGVAEVVDEDPDFVNQALNELDVSIARKRNMKGAEAYNIATSQSQEYVQRDKFRRMFLRAELFKSEQAADLILRHFEKKLELFGAEKLCKDIKLEDLSLDDMECLHNSHIRFLQARDPAGRLVLVSNTKSANYTNYEDSVNISVVVSMSN
jgi:hypothetical protein